MTLNGYGGPLHNNPTTKATLTFDRPVPGLTADDFTVTGASADYLEPGTDDNQYYLYLKEFTAENGENITVMASKSGCTFYPTSRSAPVVRGASLPISVDYFPDSKFRAYVGTDEVDANEDGYLSTDERNSVTELMIPSDCSSFGGMEHFPNLKSLVCRDNEKLTRLTMPEGLGLTALDVSGCALTELDVSQLTALETLNCGNNALTTLDVSENTALTVLNCAGNALTALDVSENTALEKLYCQNNALAALDLSENTALERLYCQSNKLLFLDLSNTAISSASNLNCTMNYGALTVGADGTCDLSGLAATGFDYTKMTVTDGGSREGSVLTVTGGSGTVSYTYDAGKSLNLSFTAYVTPRNETPTAVTFSFDGDYARKLMNTTANMKYSLDGGENWTACSEGATQLTESQVNSITADNDILVKVLADDSHAESEPHVIDITVHATPDVTFTATGPDSGTLTGVTAGMVYHDGGGAWLTASGGDISLSNLAKGKVIRAKTSRSDTRLESPEWTVTLGQAETPSPAFTATDKDAGTLSGVSAGMEYKAGDGEWTPITGTTANVTGLAKRTLLQVRVPGAGATLASAPWSLTLHKAATPEGVYTTKTSAVGGSDGRINGVNSTMEYQAQGADSWTKIPSGTAVTGLAGGDYKVRAAAKEDVLASEAVTVTVQDGGPEQYLLWVSGQRVTAEKLSDYAWAFDPATSTLTVKNGVGLVGKSSVAGPENAGVYSLLPTLTIKGPDNVDPQRVHAGASPTGANSYGIYAAGDLIITDGAYLAPLSKSIIDPDFGSYRIYVGGKLTLDGIRLYTENSYLDSSVYYHTSQGEAYGIYCDSLEIKNGTNITGWTSCRALNNDKHASAIHIVGKKSDDGFSITNSTLAIDGAYYYNGYGISFAEDAQGEINIGAGADVLIRSDRAVLTKAPVLADGVTITAGTDQTGTPQVEYSAAGLAGYRYLKMNASYGVSVAGVSVTPANKDAVTGSGITGSVTYDPLTHTLTLADAAITTTDKDTFGIRADIPQLNIVFTGSNTVNAATGGSDYDKQAAIFNTGSIILEGPGTLAVVNQGADNPSGILSTNGGISITGGQVDVTVGYAGKTCSGLLARHNLLVKNATVNVTVPASRTAYGILGNRIGASNQGTTFDHATVRVNIQEATLQSRAVGGTNLTITESSLTVTTPDQSGSVGLGGNEYCVFTFNSGEVLIQAGKATQAAITGIDAEVYDALASASYDGDGAAAYDSANTSYKYLHILPKVPPETYAITYNANGGTGTMPAGTATEGVDFTLPACGFTPPTGKCFQGWAIGSASGEVKAAGAKVVFTEATTLYATWGDLVKEDAPTTAVLTLTGEDTGTLSGVTGTMKYQVGSGAWTDGTGANIPLTELTPGLVIRVVKKGNGTTTVDSDPQVITLTRQDKPTGVTATPCTTEANNDGTLTGITAAMEWRKAGASSWTAGTGSTVTGQLTGSYEVRTKRSDTKLASEVITVTIAGYTPPDLTITLQPGSVSGDHLTLTSSIENFDMIVNTILARYDSGEMKDVCMGQLNKTTGVLTAPGKDLETGDWRVFLLGSAYAPVCEKLELSGD